MKIAQILASDVWGEVTPEAFKRGIGGREGAMMRLAREWAKLGHEVTNFVSIKESLRFKEEPRFSSMNHDLDMGHHEYVPIELARPVMENFYFDAAVAWECPSVFGSPKLRDHVPVRVTEMQVAHFMPREVDYAAEYCHAVCALSDWHAEFLLSSGLEMARDEVVTLPNGVDIQSYPERGDLGFRRDGAWYARGGIYCT